jgi:hypothetical protein
MNESVLKYAWKFRCFNTLNLVTTDGEAIEIIRPGIENSDAGPDFFLAKVRIDGTEWIGNVEIHVNSADWPRHGHDTDMAYDNVILHVVFHHNRDIFIRNRRVPTLEVKNFLSESLLANFHSIQQPFKLIPCEGLQARVEEFHKTSFLSTLLIERLADKCLVIEELFMGNRDDLTETFYQYLLMGFGQKVNKSAFELLSRKLPFRILRKYVHNELSTEALLFGVAGFLKDEIPGNDYHRSLRSEYLFLRQKHMLEEMEMSNWKFLRMRPGSFPTIRISQLAGLLLKNFQLTVLFSEMHPLRLYDDIFHVKASGYWDTHFTFKKPSPENEKYIGKDFLNHVLINVIFPFTFFTGQKIGRNYAEQIEHHYKALTREENIITRKMMAAGFRNENSAHSQALIQLNAHYCEPKKCLNCNIGYEALKL